MKTENKLVTVILDACFKIHRNLGPGLFESVYEHILNYELSNLGLKTLTQVPVPVVWKDIKMDKGFRADIIVESKVIIEIKSVEAINQYTKSNC